MTLFAVVSLLTLFLSAGNAAAGPVTLVDPLLTSDPLFVGWYHPPEPADPLDEVAYINELIKHVPGDGEVQVGDFYYDRSASPLDGPLPLAILADAIKDDDPVIGANIDVTGYTYLVGKYDGRNAGALVWLVSGMTDPVILPAKWGPSTKQYGLSHYSLYRSVPDGGATLVLLGGALMGLAALRRKAGA